MCYWGGGTTDCGNNGFSLGGGGEIWEDYEFGIWVEYYGNSRFLAGNTGKDVTI